MRGRDAAHLAEKRRRESTRKRTLSDEMRLKSPVLNSSCSMGSSCDWGLDSCCEDGEGAVVVDAMAGRGSKVGVEEGRKVGSRRYVGGCCEWDASFGTRGDVELMALAAGWRWEERVMV